MNEERQSCVVLALSVGNGLFDLEKAVCSHGFFMMAPNLWFSSSRTLQRPLRLTDSTPITVRISQSHPQSQSLTVTVLGIDSICDQDKHHLLAQVARMLRISDEDDRKINEFHQIYGLAKERGFGRVIRAPNLFEDMVKSILLCNCQWPRTLSMARALCELQSELKGDPLGYPPAEANSYPSKNHLQAGDEAVIPPTTPTPNREYKRKRGKLLPKNIVPGDQLDTSANMGLRPALDLVVQCQIPWKKKGNDDPSAAALFSIEENSTCDTCNMCSNSSCTQLFDKTVTNGESSRRIGDFPSPEEVAMLDENFLTKRCGLGYRANRILRLAQSIVQGTLQLQVSVNGEIPSRDNNYDELRKKLLGIHGIGPFTCANILMCMGFYQKIPADSETVRHLKQFHRRSGCTIRSVEQDVERIYGKYAPFKFLAYWSELWDCYEKRFGKLSEMPHSDYRVIVGSNMKKRDRRGGKKGNFMK